MFEIVKNVILGKNYKLEDMLNKIDTIWLQSKITDDEKLELIDLARENALAENSYKPLQEQIDKAFEMISELKETVETNAIGLTALKDAVEKLGGKAEIPQAPVEEEYPPFVKPNGAHDCYNEGSKMTFNGKKYICLINGCVWSPDEYPAGWKEVKEEQNNKQIASL